MPGFTPMSPAEVEADLDKRFKDRGFKIRTLADLRAAIDDPARQDEVQTFWRMIPHFPRAVIQELMVEASLRTARDAAVKRPATSTPNPIRRGVKF